MRRPLAVGEGFEPPVPFRVQRFYRPPPSATRPPQDRSLKEAPLQKSQQLGSVVVRE
jgi:hypothetical protein